jgi:hypothetical protein
LRAIVPIDAVLPLVTGGLVMLRRFALAACCLVTLAGVPAVVAATDYAGHYDSDSMAVTLAAAGDGYAGELRWGSARYPLTAHADGDHLAGTFMAGGRPFPFTAQRDGDHLTVTSGTNVHRLALRPPPPATPPLIDYTVVNHTDVGVSLIRELPAATTTRAALRTAFPDLARYFAVRPDVLGGYEDLRDHRVAFASFAVRVDGHPFKGFVAARRRDAGTAVFIVFGRQDATPAQWSALTARPTATGHAVTDMDAAMAAVPLTPYQFPDGKGAIGLAAGWRAVAPPGGNLYFAGPAGQTVHMGSGETFAMPGGRPFGTAVAPYAADPARALQNIIAANNVLMRQRTGEVRQIERIMSVTPQPPRNPPAGRFKILYDVTTTTGGGASTTTRNLLDIELHPPAAGFWNDYIYYQVAGPRETFGQDLPVMLAEVFSMRENVAAVMAQSAREIQAANALAEGQRAATNRIIDARMSQSRAAGELTNQRLNATENIERDSQLRERNAADFDEVTRGIRTVEDTTTGERTSVSLPDVHDIVDHLNEVDPGRYREIPLRDEVFPMPGHENDRDYLQR